MTVSSRRSVRLEAPCKVNLTLDVGRRRDDGYHDLESVVALFSPVDSLFISVEPGSRRVALRCSDPALPSDERNLAYRAATAFLDAAGIDAAVSIELSKHIPAEAGLGGGSSDAATVLRGLGTLFPDAGRGKTLQEIGATIGSDVPLFLCDATLVHMTGRGEIVEPLRNPHPSWEGVLVRPEVGVPTARAYALLDARTDRNPGDATRRLLKAASAGDAEGMVAAFGNDFEAVILDAYPSIADAHRTLRDTGAVRALLCGSGSAVFGLARDSDHAREMAAALQGRFPWVQHATSLRYTEASG